MDIIIYAFPLSLIKNYILFYIPTLLPSPSPSPNLPVSSLPVPHPLLRGDKAFLETDWSIYNNASR